LQRSECHIGRDEECWRGPRSENGRPEIGKKIGHLVLQYRNVKATKSENVIRVLVIMRSRVIRPNSDEALVSRTMLDYECTSFAANVIQPILQVLVIPFRTSLYSMWACFASAVEAEVVLSSRTRASSAVGV
jgi:hypothetical protein